MIRTRLLGSGALSTLAVILAAATTPAHAAPSFAPEIMLAPDAGPVSVDMQVSPAGLQERGRGGRGGGRSEGGSSMRSGSGGWNGAASRASGGGRSWGGGMQTRSSDAGSATARPSGGYERGSRSYERGSRGYTANTGNAGNYASPTSGGNYNYNRGDRSGGRGSYEGGSSYAGGSAYAGRRGGAAAAGYPSAGGTDYASTSSSARGERGNREARLAAQDRAAINPGDIQAPPSYGEGNRSGAATPYVQDNLAAQGVTVAGSNANSAVQNQSDRRRGGSERGTWSGNRGGGSQPSGEARGGGSQRGAWSGNRGGGQPGEVIAGNRERGGWDGNRRDGWRGDNRGSGDGNRRNEWRGGGDRGGWEGNRRNEWRGDARDGWRGDRRGNWADNRRDWRGDNRAGRQGAYNQGFRDGVRWDRGWRENRRFNWVGHRQANRFLFSPGRYYAPFAGHFYRPVGIGFFLDPLFFQPRFFLNDPWAFRLPPPGARFRWVRYYDDVLLVDVFTGEVVDVIQNFFW